MKYVVRLPNGTVKIIEAVGFEPKNIIAPAPWDDVLDSELIEENGMIIVDWDKRSARLRLEAKLTDIEKAKEYLNETNWLALRALEFGKEVPIEIRERRRIAYRTIEQGV